MNLNLIAILGLVLSVTGLATSSSTDDANHEAPLAVSNPRKLFEAKLLDKSNTTIRGLVNIWSQPVGVKVHVDFWGLPQNTSLPYHIHTHPVPSDGNCYSTGAHLDPYNRGEKPPCDLSRPQTCQVGDLSGKHAPAFGVLDEPFEAEYPDYYLSTDPKNKAYFGNLSVVVHAPDSQRLNCGNFVPVPMGGDDKQA